KKASNAEGLVKGKWVAWIWKWDPNAQGLGKGIVGGPEYKTYVHIEVYTTLMCWDYSTQLRKIDVEERAPLLCLN
ncbi:hypothetical protein NL449_27310, partial [Klebsiella pneumoniae]|nr:hypothetical protein [Klebsiella pneumoniae]